MTDLQSVQAKLRFGSLITHGYVSRDTTDDWVRVLEPNRKRTFLEFGNSSPPGMSIRIIIPGGSVAVNSFIAFRDVFRYEIERHNPWCFIGIEAKNFTPTEPAHFWALESFVDGEITESDIRL